MTDLRPCDLAGHGAILTAFLRARGTCRINITIGKWSGRPREVLVLVEIGGVRAVFTPFELQAMGESIVESLPTARAMGAPDAAIKDLRGFGEMLLRNAKDAAAVSPYGLH